MQPCDLMCMSPSFLGFGTWDGGVREAAAAVGVWWLYALLSFTFDLYYFSYPMLWSHSRSFIKLYWAYAGGGGGRGETYFCPPLFPHKMTGKCDIKGSGICSPPLPSLPPLIRAAGWEHLFWKKGKKIRVIHCCMLLVTEIHYAFIINFV